MDFVKLREMLRDLDRAMTQLERDQYCKHKIPRPLGIDPADVVFVKLDLSGEWYYWTCPECGDRHAMAPIDLVKIAAEVLPGQRLFRHDQDCDAQLRCNKCASWFYWSLIKGE